MNSPGPLWRSETPTVGRQLTLIVAIVQTASSSELAMVKSGEFAG